jgi:hypothetical protein
VQQVNFLLIGLIEPVWFTVKDVADANYIVSLFRWHPEEENYGNEVYYVNFRGVKINVIDHLS